MSYKAILADIAELCAHSDDFNVGEISAWNTLQP